MTYQITVSASKQSEFLQIIESLLSLGVVKKFSRAESFVVPGEPVAIDALLPTLRNRRNKLRKDCLFHLPRQSFLLNYNRKERVFYVPNEGQKYLKV